MSQKVKDVFVIPERESEDKRYGSPIGVAFVNNDQSLNVVLDAIPLSGRLHIRDRQVQNQNEKK